MFFKTFLVGHVKTLFTETIDWHYTKGLVIHRRVMTRTHRLLFASARYVNQCIAVLFCYWEVYRSNEDSNAERKITPILSRQIHNSVL